MGRKPIPLERRQERLRRERVAQTMENRIGHRLSALQTNTLLWRARRYFDDHRFAEGDVLLELVPEHIALAFLEWYFEESGAWHGPRRPLRCRTSDRP